jgi:hypothetical protein
MESLSELASRENLTVDAEISMTVSMCKGCGFIATQAGLAFHEAEPFLTSHRAASLEF